MTKILSFRFIRFHLPCQPTSTSLLKCAHVVKLAGCPPLRPSGSDYRYREKRKINFLSAAINSSVWALDCRICMFYRTDPVRISNYKVTKEQPFRRNRQRLPKTSPSILWVSYIPFLSVPLTWLSAEMMLLLHVSNSRERFAIKIPPNFHLSVYKPSTLVFLPSSARLIESLRFWNSTSFKFVFRLKKNIKVIKFQKLIHFFNYRNLFFITPP